MPREIKTTIAVDGEAAFKRAINDASTSIRNMGTQLTLAQAQFKKDGDAMKLMETRSKALKSEISQQEEIVKALEKAVKDSSEAYGENSAKTEKWEADLNRAAMVIGSEGRGVGEFFLTHADRELIIPMSARCESLNAAIAAAIVMWEMKRNCM